MIQPVRFSKEKHQRKFLFSHFFLVFQFSKYFEQKSCLLILKTQGKYGRKIMLFRNSWYIVLILAIAATTFQEADSRPASEIYMCILINNTCCQTWKLEVELPPLYICMLLLHCFGDPAVMKFPVMKPHLLFARVSEAAFRSKNFAFVLQNKCYGILSLPNSCPHL